MVREQGGPTVVGACPMSEAMTGLSVSEGRGGGVSHPQAFQGKKGPTFFI